MTTIAYRNGVMAADSFETWENDIIHACARKLHKFGHTIIGIAGDIEAGTEAAIWYADQSKEKPTYDSEDDFELLILNPTGLFSMGRRLVPLMVRTPYCAIGTGAAIATGALFAGADAATAVKAASKHDPFTGGRVVTMAMDG